MYPRSLPPHTRSNWATKRRSTTGRVRKSTLSTRPRRACGGCVTVPRALTRLRRRCAGDGDSRGRRGRRPDTQATRAPPSAGAAGRVARRSTGTTRRWLLGRGVAAAMLPVISSIVAPSPVEAQSPGPGAPTLTSLSPNQGIQGTTVAVMLTGTNFVAGATTVTVSGGGVTVNNVDRGQHYVADRQLRDRFGRSDRCPHGDGHDGGRDQRRANLHGQPAAAGRADADQRRAESRHPGHHGGGHADGHQFRRRRHDGDRRR